MVHPCDKPCGNKTASGYCATTACINPQFSNIGTAQYGQGVQKRIITNGDRIRSMSDEELAEFLDRWEMGDIDYSKTFCDLCEGQYDCHDDCWLDWLKQEVKE